MSVPRPELTGMDLGGACGLPHLGPAAVLESHSCQPSTTLHLRASTCCLLIDRRGPGTTFPGLPGACGFVVWQQEVEHSVPPSCHCEQDQEDSGRQCRRGCSGRQMIAVVLFETRSLCGSGCPRVFSVDQAGLEPLSAGIKATRPSPRELLRWVHWSQRC